MTPSPLELPPQLFLQLSLVKSLGQTVTNHQLVNRFMVGMFRIAFVQKLEMHRPDLESIATAQHLAAFDWQVVDIGAVGAAQVFDLDPATPVNQPRMAAGNRSHIRQTDLGILRATNFHRAHRQHTVAIAQGLFFRMSDQNDVGFGWLLARLTITSGVALASPQNQ